VEKYIKVVVGGVYIYTSLEEIADYLRELDYVLSEGTAENADLDCVFKALNYLKKYKSRNPDVVIIVRSVERILKKDLEEGKIDLWGR